MLWVAHDMRLERDVAIKVLLPSLAVDKTEVARFLAQAQASVRLRSRHTVRVYDAGIGEPGVPFMVMELLTGRDLESVLSERGSLPVAVAVGYLLQAAEGIAEAHAHGIVHRDIKPQNLFLATAPDGRAVVKVLDFGLAKRPRSSADLAATERDEIVGSPHYVSPEQLCVTEDVDARSDVWSLGVSLYQMVTGRLPFEAPSVLEIIVRILGDEPLAPQALAPHIPADLSNAILRCLDKDPARRFQDVAELASVLERFGGKRTAGRAERVAKVLAMRPSPRSEAPATPLTTQPPRRCDVETPLAVTLPTIDPHGIRATEAPVHSSPMPPSRRRGRPRAVALVFALLALIVTPALPKDRPTQPHVEGIRRTDDIPPPVLVNAPTVPIGNEADARARAVQVSPPPETKATNPASRALKLAPKGSGVAPSPAAPRAVTRKRQPPSDD
jgi:serine/threonine-protein kinase